MTLRKVWGNPKAQLSLFEVEKRLSELLVLVIIQWPILNQLGLNYTGRGNEVNLKSIFSLALKLILCVKSYGNCINGIEIHQFVLHFLGVNWDMKIKIIEET